MQKLTPLLTDSGKTNTLSRMKKLSIAIKTLIFLVVLVGAATFVISNYSWVFAKRVHGEILDVQRVTDPSAIISSRVTEEQMYSYSILIQGEDGRLYTASSEDRQWQVAKKGYCVEALLYRYPPWDLQKANTFFNARLEELKVCPGKTAPDLTAPTVEKSARPKILPESK